MTSLESVCCDKKEVGDDSINIDEVDKSSNEGAVGIGQTSSVRDDPVNPDLAKAKSSVIAGEIDSNMRSDANYTDERCSQPNLTSPEQSANELNSLNTLILSGDNVDDGLMNIERVEGEIVSNVVSKTFSPAITTENDGCSSAFTECQKSDSGTEDSETDSSSSESEEADVSSKSERNGVSSGFSSSEDDVSVPHKKSIDRYS